MRFQSDSTQVVASISFIDYGTTLIVGDTASIAAFYVVIPGTNDGSETVPNGLYACEDFFFKSSNGGRTDDLSSPSRSLPIEPFGLTHIRGIIPCVPGGIQLWTAVRGIERRRWRSGSLGILGSGSSGMSSYRVWIRRENLPHDIEENTEALAF
jgi:hypothetical protein